MDNIRELFAGFDSEMLDKAVVAAEKRTKPSKPTKRTVNSTGEYNAVTVPVVPHSVTSVTDGSKDKLDYRVVGQQIVASRRFVPPVIIEYVTPAEYEKRRSAMIVAVHQELEK